jgi:hypothetical protein
MDMQSGYIPMNRPFENGGYRPSEPTVEEKEIEANWGKNPHAVRTAVGRWVLRIARGKDGILDTTLNDRLVEKAEMVLQANSGSDDLDKKISPASVTCELRRLFESAT